MSQIIPIVNILNLTEETHVILLRQWVLAKHDKRKIHIPRHSVEDQHGRIIRVGQVSLKPYLYISNALLVDRLNLNLLSISQLCDNGCDVVFDRNKCTINKYDGTCLLTAKRQ